MSEQLTIEEVMGRMPKAFLPEKAEGVSAEVQYHLSGAEAGDWIITIGDGECQVEQGEADNPTLTLAADSDDYLKVLTGELNAMNAFAAGKLKLKGDLSLAMKLMNYFKLPAD